MCRIIFARLFCLLVVVPLAAMAIEDPEAVRDSTPDVLVCCLGNVEALEGEKVSAYSASCVVQEVIRSSVPVEPGDTLAIAYEVHHAAFDRPDSAEPGLSFPTPPPPISNHELVTAYLHRTQDAAGHVVYAPHIGMDSFEPGEREGVETSAACSLED